MKKLRTKPFVTENFWSRRGSLFVTKNFWSRSDFLHNLSGVIWTILAYLRTLSSYHIWRACCNGSYTMMAKQIRALELHYPMIQFLIMMLIIFSKDTWLVHCGYVWIHFTLHQSYLHYRHQNFPKYFIAFSWYLTSKVVRENS